jgi:hypothetical protein
MSNATECCTTLDHIYPACEFPCKPGTRCYCGKRMWGERTTTGSNILVRGQRCRVVKELTIDGDRYVKLDRAIGGRKMYRLEEL